jgi:hypothetical protein
MEATTNPVNGIINRLNINTNALRKNPIRAANNLGPALISTLGSGSTFSN